MVKFVENNFIVTGGKGFLGRHVVQHLKDVGIPNEKISIISSSDFDLRDINDVKKILKYNDIVIHLAANLGGLAVNIDRQADFFYDNAIMGINLIKVGQEVGIKKFVGIGSIWEYPDKLSIPFKEKNLWNGYPSQITAPYGLAKKVMLMMSQFFNDQYKFNGIHLLLTNLYGPGDDFNPSTSHVIPSLIYKIDQAKLNNLAEIDVWGDGSASRELLFVKDAAEAIIRATKLYNNKSPVNIGSGTKTTIKELIYTLKELMNFQGNIRWDTSKLVGQRDNQFDVSLASKSFGFTAKTSLIEGLQQTINWYFETKDQVLVNNK